MTTARFIVGDSLTVLRTLPDASVDLVLTSPPFLALRSYLPADHPDKASEVGAEPTPGEFIDTLLDIIEECRRVLAPHGSICFELGDTYAGSGGGGGDYLPGGLREGQAQFAGSAASMRESNAAHWRQKNQRVTNTQDGRRVRWEDEALGIIPARSRPGPEQRDFMDGWPMDKSLCLVPELLRLSLAYGVNPLTGRTTEPWRIRNVVRWCRPNPPVGALADKFRPGTSDMLVACVDRQRYFDLDAVRTPHKADPDKYTGNGYTKGNPSGEGEDNAMPGNPIGAPPLDWWKISTEPYKGSHYAVWPTALLVKPIKAMCPERVCTTCGEPSRRIVDAVTPRDVSGAVKGKDSTQGRNVGGIFGKSHTVTPAEYETVGWTDCGHDSWRKGVVLDPFAGSGTTLAVATGHGRDAIGIDLDERNIELARERVGMFLEVAEPGVGQAAPDSAAQSDSARPCSPVCTCGDRLWPKSDGYES